MAGMGLPTYLHGCWPHCRPPHEPGQELQSLMHKQSRLRWSCQLPKQACVRSPPALCGVQAGVCPRLTLSCWTGWRHG
jgi:hypothetical protein